MSNFSARMAVLGYVEKAHGENRAVFREGAWQWVSYSQIVQGKGKALCTVFDTFLKFRLSQNSKRQTDYMLRWWGGRGSRDKAQEPRQRQRVRGASRCRGAVPCWLDQAAGPRFGYSRHFILGASAGGG